VPLERRFAVATTFTYDVALDFPGGKCNLINLANEIRASAITVALAGVSASSPFPPVNDVVSAGQVSVEFKANL